MVWFSANWFAGDWNGSNWFGAENAGTPTAGSGTFTITGTSATLTHGAAGNYSLTASAGSVLVVGTAATLTVVRVPTQVVGGGGGGKIFVPQYSRRKARKLSLRCSPGAFAVRSEDIPLFVGIDWQLRAAEEDELMAMLFQ